jgi:ribosomal protein RSM22 (predicted rRNA methylase)
VKEDFDKKLYNFSIDSINWARIINRPLKRSGHVYLDLCTNEGEIKKKHVITKNENAYKFSRKSFWRDLFPFIFDPNYK